MANRFRDTKKKARSPLLSLVLPVILFVGVVGLFFFGVSSISDTTEAERLRSAENAVTKAVVQCYALEGQYPPNIDYLRENYGLSVDEEKYIIHYDVFASNLMPQITVLPRDF